MVLTAVSPSQESDVLKDGIASRREAASNPEWQCSGADEATLQHFLADLLEYNSLLCYLPDVFDLTSYPLNQPKNDGRCSLKHLKDNSLEKAGINYLI